MFKNIAKTLGGDPVKKMLEKYREMVEEINALEPGLQALSDEALKAKTDEFKGRIRQGETLEDLIIETFAVVREAAVRTVGLRHFDVQLVGGIVLHEGQIAEMKTGEGKTLVATMPIYLNALEEQGVHLVTVNDYLARRDARWMGPIFHFLGLSVGILQEASRTEHGKKAFFYDPELESVQEDVHQLRLVDRKIAYAADVIYGTNNEFGFDYLRDNMARTLEARSQRGHHFAILDEVDNILIDEARTPLIISGPAHDDPGLYVQMAQVVKQLNAEDFEVSEKDRTVALTEIGENHVEQLLKTPIRDPDRPEDISPEQARLLGHLEQGLRAEHLFKRNKDYVVQAGRVIIVDEFTGRMMAGRRWSDGLHQAVEAKEGVRVRQENVTYATVTLQNYFRMYKKLAGMTGTAVTEAEEFSKIYDVDVIPLPTNLEFIALRSDADLKEIAYTESGSNFSYYARMDDQDQKPIFWRRKDFPDIVFRTEEAKLRAVTLEILRRHTLGQPLLVGTTSVELSERLSSRLRAEALQKLANIQIVRDAYLEAHDIPADGMRVDALESLYQPLPEIKQPTLRPFARDLDISLNPTREENLERLLMILDLEPSDLERLTEALKGGVPHNVLNAKKHDEESAIIAWAGSLGAVTIATNMAGRGVDIKLGGEIAEEILAAVNRVLRRIGIRDPENMSLDERLGALENADKDAIGIYEAEIDQLKRFIEDSKRVWDVGGLHVVGSERHESRRIDNQLRGRAARQGDPGSSQFFLSLGDELMRLFGGAQVANLMQRFNIDDAVPIVHNIVNRTIEQAQTRVEGANFDTRKHLLDYDDVLNQQREVFYNQRNRVFTKDSLSDDIASMLRTVVEEHVQMALADPEGPWKLLAWLEETQPTIGLESDEPYPSFMLRELLTQFEDISQADELKKSLLEIARGSLDANKAHLQRAVDEQLARALERLDEQVDQRVDIAEMAVDAAIYEAEDEGRDVDPRSLLSVVEQAAGLRIQMDDGALQQVREDPQNFQQRIREMVDASFSLRIWAGLIQAVERRIGESLNLKPSLSGTIDWDQASDDLQKALESVWDARTKRILGEIETDLQNAVREKSTLEARDRIRFLIQMSYGQRSFFDRKTHQRQSVKVARLTYPFYAANLISDRDPQELTEQVVEHLTGAQESLKELLGSAAFSRLAVSKLDQLEARTQEQLRSVLGQETFDQYASQGSLSSLPEDAREIISGVMGNQALIRAHRELFLSVGDREWVDYLTQMEALRTSIGLEAYGQRDPLVQYKSRAFDLFNVLLASIRAGVVAHMFRLRTTPGSSTAAKTAPAPRLPEADVDKPESTAKKSGKRRKRKRKRK